MINLAACNGIYTFKCHNSESQSASLSVKTILTDLDANAAAHTECDLALKGQHNWLSSLIVTFLAVPQLPQVYLLHWNTMKWHIRVFSVFFFIFEEIDLAKTGNFNPRSSD